MGLADRFVFIQLQFLKLKNQEAAAGRDALIGRDRGNDHKRRKSLTMEPSMTPASCHTSCCQVNGVADCFLEKEKSGRQS